MPASITDPCRPPSRFAADCKDQPCQEPPAGHRRMERLSAACHRREPCL